jgi:serine/threonine-protein kinase PknG
MAGCVQPGCTGSYDADGYCTECGFKAPDSVQLLPAAAPNGTSGVAAGPNGGGAKSSAGAASVATAAAGPVTLGASGPATVAASMASLTGSGRSRTRSTGGSRRLGAGLLEIPPVTPRDPATAVLTDPQVPESRRMCGACGEPVGRSRDGRPGLTEGFCSNCGTRFHFTPGLAPGDMVGGRYKILGCLAYGGFGWIYLARDESLSDEATDHWVVLKGLIDTGDPDAVAAAIAERRSLVGLDHPAIVNIHDFVQHPDPRTNVSQGYIVMEYLGGKSVREIARENRAPLPLAQVIAYVLEVLPAFSHLHERGLLYCDLKPDNLMHVGDQIKLIDLGGVIRIDGDHSVVYGTPGFQAPEIENRGPSIASDIYTIGRTLAILSLGYDMFRSKERLTSLPPPEQAPLLAQRESYHRLLRKATDPVPERRFASAEEMREQLLGVLREVLATADGQPRPAVSTWFTPPRHTFGAELGALPPPKDPPRAVAWDKVAAALPAPQVEATDPAAGFLATLGAIPPAELVNALLAAPVDSPEVSLQLVAARIAQRDLDGADDDLDAYQKRQPYDWRVPWYRGMIALAARQAAEARDRFDQVYSDLPGELAPQLALAAAAEWAGDGDAAARRYERVWRTDRNFVSAAFGVARQRWRQDDFAGVVAVLDEVPETSIQHHAAQIAAVLARLAPPPRQLSEQDLHDAAGRLRQLDLDGVRHKRLTAVVLATALDWVRAGGTSGGGRLLDHPIEERELQFGLERTYRDLAQLVDDPHARVWFVDRANQVRPRTWF